MNTCSMCRFWFRDYPHPIGSSRPCLLFSDDPSFDRSKPEYPLVENQPEHLAVICPWAGTDGATFETEPMFGCVQWEPR